MQQLHLTEYLLRYLMRIPVNYLQEKGLKIYDVYYELAKVLMFTGNWEESLKHLNIIKEMNKQFRSDLNYIFTLVNSKKEMANIINDLQRPDKAVEEVDGALDLIKMLKRNNKVCSVQEDLWARKGTIFWFNGHFRDGIKWHKKAYESAVKAGGGVRISFALREFGTLTLHEDSAKGVAMLKEGLGIVKNNRRMPAQDKDIIKVQLLMGELLNTCRKTDEYDLEKIQTIRNSSVALYDQCMNKNMSIYNASLCSLICGACEATLHEYEDAYYWFKQAIINSTHGNLIDVLWKARLNLSQVCNKMHKDNYLAESRMHSDEAFHKIKRSLDQLRGSYKEKRQALMRFPLLHILRINPSLENRIKKYLSHPIKLSLTDWENRPNFLSGPGQDQQVLHIRDGDNDYFLMN